MIKTINILLPLLYAVAALLYYSDFKSDFGRFAGPKHLALYSVLIIHLAYGTLLYFSLDRLPITNLYEVLSLSSFLVALVYLILESKAGASGTGAVVLLCAFLLQLISTAFIKENEPIKEILKNRTLGFHVFSSVAGYISVTLSGLYGILYLSMNKKLRSGKFGVTFFKLPSLASLFKISYYFALSGLIFLTVGILVGISWLFSIKQENFLLDTKLIGTFLVWLICLILVLIGPNKNISESFKVKLSIAGFLMAVLSTTAAYLFSNSFHLFN